MVILKKKGIFCFFLLEEWKVGLGNDGSTCYFYLN